MRTLDGRYLEAGPDGDAFKLGRGAGATGGFVTYGDLPEGDVVGRGNGAGDGEERDGLETVFAEDGEDEDVEIAAGV